MRISDWSSDVCSSDLAGRPLGRLGDLEGLEPRRDVDAVVGGRLLRERLGLGLHDVRQRRITRLVEAQEIGRASCRERVCQYGWISVGAVARTKKTKTKTEDTLVPQCCDEKR